MERRIIIMSPLHQDSIHLVPQRSVVLKSQVSDVLQEISFGKNSTLRWRGLKRMQQLLEGNHGIQALDRGADRMLAWQLTQHLNAEPPDREPTALILECLHLLWTQCPADRLVQSAHDLIDVLPWLVHAWQCFPDDSQIVERVLSILRIWSKFKDSHIKSKLIRSGVVKYIKASLHENPTKVCGLVKDFTFRASGSDKEYLYTSLKKQIIINCQSDQSNIVEAMTATLWNLATEHGIGKSMAMDSVVWDTLHRIGQTWSGRNGLAIVRHWSSITGNIVAIAVLETDSSTCVKLIEKQRWLIPCLLDTLQAESDCDLRRRCTRTIRCLLSCSWGQHFTMDNADATIITNVLSNLATNQSNDSDTRVQACQAVRSMLLVDNDVRECNLAASLIRILDERNVESKLAANVLQILSTMIAAGKWNPDMTSLSGVFLPRISFILIFEWNVSHSKSFPALLKSFFLIASLRYLNLLDQILKNRGNSPWKLRPTWLQIQQLKKFWRGMTGC
ncbi:hypothetical protein FisN_3Lh473 [Fistulifera solaris]|uniref:Uncharacterized protein n=1 Tax=Fistulifera solaris TaxID=1519565 RepID=A0A1Z5J927_FISSO|nr:hypothetical protein FisN_3Lh473 [Fistulifera solaris]|eukprot:GAX10271.1 hypothetical protein FisN_3Lh473 [Fistulifera solaris]